MWILNGCHRSEVSDDILDNVLPFAGAHVSGGSRLGLKSPLVVQYRRSSSKGRRKTPFRGRGFGLSGIIQFDAWVEFLEEPKQKAL